MAAVDAVVESYVVGLLARSNASTLFADDTTAEELDRLSAAELANNAAVAEANALRRDGTMTMAAYATVTADLEAEADRITAARGRLALDDVRDADVVDGLTGPDAATTWADLDLGRKRAVIDRLVAITVTSPKPRARWTPSDVAITRRSA
jgi:hypothetical protein